MSERATDAELCAAWARAGRFYEQRCRDRGIPLPSGFIDQLRLYEFWSRTVADDRFDAAQIPSSDDRRMTMMLTVDDVADELQQGLTTVKRLIRDHELVAVKIGRTTRIRRSDLDAYIAGLDPRGRLVTK